MLLVAIEKVGHTLKLLATVLLSLGKVAEARQYLKQVRTEIHR